MASAIWQENIFDIINFVRAYELMNGNKTNSVFVRPVNDGDNVAAHIASAQVISFHIHSDGPGPSPMYMLEAIDFKETKVTTIELPPEDEARVTARREDLVTRMTERFNGD